MPWRCVVGRLGLRLWVQLRSHVPAQEGHGSTGKSAGRAGKARVQLNRRLLPLARIACCARCCAQPAWEAVQCPAAIRFSQTHGRNAGGGAAGSEAPAAPHGCSPGRCPHGRCCGCSPAGLPTCGCFTEQALTARCLCPRAWCRRVLPGTGGGAVQGGALHGAALSGAGGRVEQALGQLGGCGGGAAAAPAPLGAPSRGAGGGIAAGAGWVWPALARIGCANLHHCQLPGSGRPCLPSWLPPPPSAFQGHYSTVWRVLDATTGQHCAMKVRGAGTPGGAGL